jgi:hypothetical protein
MAAALIAGGVVVIFPIQELKTPERLPPGQ